MSEEVASANINNNVVEHVNEEQEFFFEEPDQNSWTPSGVMADLPSEIFRKNLLSSSTRKTILQAEPRNRCISFSPPNMDQRIWNSMSRTSRDHDKDIRSLLYRFSAAIRPIDNSLRLIYASKPEEAANKETKEAWLQLEQTVLNSRALVLDALSFGNDLRKEQALKSISPNFKKPTEHEEVFGEDLVEIIRRENETNKLFNDAAWQKRRSNQSYTSRTQSFTPVNFKLPSKPSNYRGRGRGSNWQPRTQNQGNQYNGGQQNRQSST